MNRRDDVFGLFPRLLGLVAGILILLSAIMTTGDVVLREIRGHGVRGIVELSEVGLVVIVMLAAVYAQHRDGHVSSDILGPYVPRRMLDIVLALCLLGVSLCLGWVGLRAVTVAQQAWDTGALRPGIAQVPVWPARWAIAAGFSLLAAQTLIAAIKLATRSLRPDKTSNSLTTPR